jgi:hypothetical protein
MYPAELLGKRAATLPESRADIGCAWHCHPVEHSCTCVTQFCSRGYVGLLEYVPFGKLGSFAAPWLNLRVGVQYTAYQRFNGGGANYDGFGRSASDNNTLFGFFWFAI